MYYSYIVHLFSMFYILMDILCFMLCDLQLKYLNTFLVAFGDKYKHISLYTVLIY